VKHPDPSAHAVPGDVVPHWETLSSLTGWKKSSVHLLYHQPCLPSPPPSEGTSSGHSLNHTCQVTHGGVVLFLHSQKSHAARLKLDTTSPPTQLVERTPSSPSSLTQGLTAVTGPYYKQDQSTSRFLKDLRAPVKQYYFFF